MSGKSRDNRIFFLGDVRSEVGGTVVVDRLLYLAATTQSLHQREYQCWVFEVDVLLGLIKM